MISDSPLLHTVNAKLHAQTGQLPEHVAQCRAARGAWFPAALAVEAVHKLLVPRFVTTVVVAGVGLVIANALA